MRRWKKIAKPDANGFYECNTKDSYWWSATRRIPEILKEHERDLHSRPVGPPWLIKLLVGRGHGLIYDMTFSVAGANGRAAIYKAIYFVNPGSIPNEIKSFEKVMGSEEPTTINILPIASAEAIILGLGIPNIYLRAFQVLMEKKKKKNPGWSYAKVRKSAKAEWQKLSEFTKGELMVEATLRYNRKAKALNQHQEEERLMAETAKMAGGKAVPSDALNKHKKEAKLMAEVAEKEFLSGA